MSEKSLWQTQFSTLAVHQKAFLDSMARQEAPRRVLLISPPGTGRSTTLAATITLLRTRHGEKGQTLVLSPMRMLQEQWAALFARYGLSVEVVDAPKYRAWQAETEAGRNPWDRPGIFVTSADFVSRDLRLREVLGVHWNEILVDELGVLSKSGQDVVNALWESANVDMAFASSGVRPEWLPLKLPTHVAEWSRSDLARSGFVFPERDVRITHFQWSQSERDFISHLLEILAPLRSSRAPSDSFFASVLLKRMASSCYSIEQTLRRLAVRSEFESDSVLVEDLEELPRVTRPLLRDDQVQTLLNLLENTDRDSKWEACANLIEIIISGETQQSPIIIFAEFADTAEYISELTKERGWTSYVVTGQKTSSEKWEALERARQRQSILILTTSLIGVDTSFGNQVIHYDLPSTNSLLLQRFGRVERITSKFKVVHHHFLADDLVNSRLDVQNLLNSL